MFEIYQKIMSIVIEDPDAALPALLTAIDFCRARIGMSVEDIAEMMSSVEEACGEPKEGEDLWQLL